jgi:hypothetical protein
MAPVMHMFVASEHAEQRRLQEHSTLHEQTLIGSCPRQSLSEGRNIHGCSPLSTAYRCNTGPDGRKHESRMRGVAKNEH